MYSLYVYEINHTKFSIRHWDGTDLGPGGRGGKIGAAWVLGCDAGGGGGRGPPFFISGPKNKQKKANLEPPYFYLNTLSIENVPHICLSL